MSTKKLYSMGAGAVIVIVLLAGGLFASSKLRAAPKMMAAKKGGGVNFVQLPQRTVIFRIHRGSYDTLSDTYKALDAVRAKLKIKETGPSGSGIASYLNASASSAVDPKEQLIEVQIEVDPAALSKDAKASKLLCAKDGGTGGIKVLPPMLVGMLTKPVGVSDPSSLYIAIHHAIDANGLTAVGQPIQVFPNARQISSQSQFSDLQCDCEIPTQ